MLSVLFWILCGAGVLCLIVFPGKRKGVPLVSGREETIFESACNITAVILLLIQMIFPLYGYALYAAPSSFYNNPPIDSKWISETGEVFYSVFKGIAVNFNRDFPPDAVPGNSVYLLVILTSVFCFFAGVCIYSNGLKLKHKIFLLIPLFVIATAPAYSKFFRLRSGFQIHNYLRLLLIILEDSIVRYLFGSLMMIALLYGIYLLLKKILKNEIVPLIVILALSFFAPFIRIVNDGMNLQGPELRYLQFGPDVPLFPIGMIVMKFRDRLLPKTNKGALLHIISWILIGGLSFYSLSAFQKLLLNRAGLHISDGYTCMPDEDFNKNVATLEKIYKLECIPWLVFGFALSMLLLVIVSFARTGNSVTRFCRANCYLISVLLFSMHLFRMLYGKPLKFWTDVAGLKNKQLVIVPFIHFALFMAFAHLINLIIKKVQEKRIQDSAE